jgi:hypothetical protein
MLAGRYGIAGSLPGMPIPDHRALGNLDRHGVHFLTAYVAVV